MLFDYRSASSLDDGNQFVDFSQVMDKTPISVHCRTPVEYIMDIFKKVGPRYVVVKEQGRLAGIITKKDLLFAVNGERLDVDYQETLGRMSIMSVLSANSLYQNPPSNSLFQEDEHPSQLQSPSTMRLRLQRWTRSLGNPELFSPRFRPTILGRTRMHPIPVDNEEMELTTFSTAHGRNSFHG